MRQSGNQSQRMSMAAKAAPGLPSIRFGDTGDAVRVLQRLLLSSNYFVRVDGSFGALTETAVKSFQNQRRIPADGVVGQRTWRELTLA